MADISHIVYIGIVYKILLTIPFECIVYVIDNKRCCRYNHLGKPVVRLAMLSGSHSIIEGITLIILGLFMYFWTVALEPFVTLSQIACNLSEVSKVLSQICAEIHFKSNVISYTPYAAIVISIFGGTILVKGIVISSRKRRYTWGK